MMMKMEMKDTKLSGRDINYPSSDKSACLAKLIGNDLARVCKRGENVVCRREGEVISDTNTR